MSSDGELAHLLPVHRSYALLAAAERVDWIRQERWIQYTRAEEVLVRMASTADPAWLLRPLPARADAERRTGAPARGVDVGVSNPLSAASRRALVLLL